MPWRERSPMDERVQFISDYLRQLWTMTQLCHRFGISRKTAYKWIARYEGEGATGLEARSSRPGCSPQATAPREVAAIVALRKRHPSWGGKKIVAVLRERHPTWTLPAISTANDILKRHHLVPTRRRRRALAHPGYQPSVVSAPNLVWTADFKGQFRTAGWAPVLSADGLRCLQSLRAGLSGLACPDDPRRRQRFSPAVPAVRVAAGDPHGQR